MAKDKETASTVPKQLTPWRPGQSGNPAGRAKGSRNKLSEDFVAKLYDDFTLNGQTAIEQCRVNSPETYVRVIAGLLPKEVHLKEAPLEEMSDDDIRDALERIAVLRSALIGADGAKAESGSAATGKSKPH